MSNLFFQFKQFTVFQSQSAMKVGADGVTLGAWVDVRDSQKILDIGTGTGLIALMLAQRSKAKITAIDIDSSSAIQAKDNVKISHWSDRINVEHTSLQSFSKSTTDKFDLIVCNPPYFVNSMKSPSKTRSLARHNDTLPFDILIANVKTMLSENGKFCVILPVVEGTNFIALCSESGLNCNKKTRLFPNNFKPAKRLLLEFGKKNAPTNESDLIIEIDRHIFTSQYASLVKDFYLKL